jgi:hypothetical protein
MIGPPRPSDKRRHFFKPMTNEGRSGDGLFALANSVATGTLDGR